MRIYCECVDIRRERGSVAVTHNKTEKGKECKKGEYRFVGKSRRDDFCETDL